MNTQKDISIIIPAFNEKNRLPLFLKNLVPYCTSQKRTSEIIIVDDGSTDDTHLEALKFKAQFPDLRIERLDKNKGVGGASKCGFFASTGKVIVFVDADGSIGPHEIEKQLSFFTKEVDIIVGSRALKESEQTTSIPLYRRITSLIFNSLVQLLLFKGIKDTQSGFMIAQREVMQQILPQTHIQGFGFYIELLYLAKKMDYKIKESPVSWDHKSGGTVSLMRDSLTMFLNILQIKIWHSSFKNKETR